MKIRYRLLLVSLILLSFGIVFPGLASAQDEQDPPSRVARLNYVDGSVSFQPSGEQDWVQADVNRPLTTGDNLWSDQNSRGELHIGRTSLRLGSQTGISFLNLNDQAVQIQLAEGSLSVHVRRLDPDEAYEVDGPNLAFSILRPGEYRFNVDPDGTSTTISVYSGQGTVTGGGRTYNITPGQRAVFNGTDQLSYNVQQVAPDSFDEWGRGREMREEHSVSARYVSPDMTGYEDLDDHGSWRSDPQYGSYWVPNGVEAGWAPYHEGRWAWVAPWGWTWVDAEPWGFAPFHYGRWAVIGDSWGWVPGPVAETRCVYAPALVGFVGGGGFGVSIGFGGGEGVAWFPLGPRDVFVPAYQVSPRYVEAVNVSNTTVINRTTITTVYNNYTVNHVTNVNYTYANNTNAVTAVNREAFVSGKPVAQAAIRVNAEEIQHPRVVETAALTPSHASVVGVAAAAHATPPAAIANRKVVTKMAPSPQAAPIGKPRPQANPNLSAAVVNRAGFSPQAQTVRAAAVARTVAAAPNKPAATPEPSRPGTSPNEARPNEARPNETQPNRPATPPNQPKPFTPPNRPNENPNQPRTQPTPDRQPDRTVKPPADQPRPQPQPENKPRTVTPPPDRQPDRTVKPPADQPRPQPQPENKPRTVTPPPDRQPDRAVKPPAEPRPQPQPENKPRTATPPPPERKVTPPAEQPRPETKPRPATPPEHPATKEKEPPKEPPKQPPKPEDKPKEKPKPEPQPQF